jgi:hypothetical protein
MMKVKPIASYSPIWKTIVEEMNLQMKLEGRSIEIVKSFDTIDEIVEYLLQQLK